MTVLSGFIGVFALLQGFTLDASGSGSVILPFGVDSARSYLQRIGTLEKHMPGVVGITPRTDGGFDYQTAKEIPFSGEMRSVFVVRCVRDTTGDVLYESPDGAAPNWMRFRFSFAPAVDGGTLVRMTLHVRLVRESGTDIHLLAPVLGEGFLSEHMRDDISEMLELFAERLEHACTELPAGVSVHAQ